MTEHRRQLLDTLNQSGEPLNAQQIYKLLEGRADRATIYRALKYLEHKKYISSFVFDCDQRGIERYYSSRKEKHEHFMHCMHCHRFITVDDCPLGDSVQKIEASTGFQVAVHELTLKGICRDCRTKEIL